ncbi:AAA family ATPase [Streptomyces sp. A012304]|uniref:AAA family ATPase n=1 Tax=Streptomyces sp. A012304 TaxID=375446 RepID=UPI0035D50CFF
MEFDPAADTSPPPGRDVEGRADTVGYAADHEVYVFDDEEVVLAVNVALKTGRPLLLFGPPGSGKSSLAPNVARILGWDFHPHVVTARTEPEDLLWRFDALRRLNDAQARKLHPDIRRYYTKGPLWRAFAGPERSVVLIDEIDKADPDLPNSLLGPLGSLSFALPWCEDDHTALDDADGNNGSDEAGEAGEAGVMEKSVSVPPERAPLVVITTNDERELPKPFLRRCIVVELEAPTRKHLLKVAAAHLGDRYDAVLAGQVADHIIGVRGMVRDAAAGPSTAEYLDALKASQQLGVTPGTPEWKALETVTLRKRREGTEGGA